MIHRRYLSRLFLGRLLATLGGLAALLQLLDLLDNASDVLARGGMSDLGRYVAWRLPSVLGQMMPLAVLVAGMLTLRRLAMTLEMSALRAAGVPVRAVLRAMMPACLLAALAQAALLSQVAPRTERALSDWMAQTAGRVTRTPQKEPPRIWLRAGPQIIGIDRLSADARQLQGVTLITRAPTQVAETRLTAASAEFTPQGWVLRDVGLAGPGTPRVQHVAQRPWPEGPTPAEIIEVARPTNAQSPGYLWRALRGEQATGRGPAFFATRLQEAVARLASPFVMLLLAGPVAFALPRRGGQMMQPLLCLALGLGYLLLGGLMGALGESGVLPVGVAVWSAPLAFAALGITLLLRLDEG